MLEKRGYQVQLRGIVPVKGKGDMETYYVMGRRTGRAPGFVRQPSTYSSLATVVYGMLQARRRQTIKKVVTREWFLHIVTLLETHMDCIPGRFTVIFVFQIKFGVVQMFIHSYDQCAGQLSVMVKQLQPTPLTVGTQLAWSLAVHLKKKKKNSMV
jgi:hypothetical protein